MLLEADRDHGLRRVSLILNDQAASVRLEIKENKIDNHIEDIKKNSAKNLKMFYKYNNIAV